MVIVQILSKADKKAQQQSNSHVLNLPLPGAPPWMKNFQNDRLNSYQFIFETAEKKKSENMASVIFPRSSCPRWDFTYQFPAHGLIKIQGRS